MLGAHHAEAMAGRRLHHDEGADVLVALGAEILEALGAKRLRNVRTFVVMEAPTGHRFCVVRAQRPDFLDKANLWP